MTRCACNLPIDPPAHLRWWRPDLDEDPEPPVCAVVRWGEDPRKRRAVRLGDGVGWAEYGDGAVFTGDLTVPLDWSRVGLCQHRTPHPVVAVWQPPGGSGWAYQPDDRPATINGSPQLFTDCHRVPGLRLHVVLERASKWSVPSDYLGRRITNDPDPRALSNIGHVIALVRGSKDLIRPGHSVRVYLEGQRPQRWRLDPCGRGLDPIITDLHPVPCQKPSLGGCVGL